MFYQRILKPVLFQVDPEHVHRAIVPLGELFGRSALGRGMVAAAYGHPPAGAAVTVDGVHYQSPVVLAAGFDANGRLANVLRSVSFGGMEVGSITARPCAGNPSPNQSRLKHTQSIIVNKGLRNEGVVRVAERLAKRKQFPDFAVGVSIARTNDTESCELSAGIEDYAASLSHLTAVGVGAWYTINISCPNTYTGELFVEPENLDRLLTRLDSIATDRPVYLKMPISVPEQRFRALGDVAARHRVRGLIIGNLQKDYTHIDARDPRPSAYRGGLSGAPCRTDANRLLSLAHETYGERFTLIGCGGTLSVEDAQEKFARGAKLIHLITGMIFTGPSLMRDIAREYVKEKRVK